MERKKSYRSFRKRKGSFLAGMDRLETIESASVFLAVPATVLPLSLAMGVNATLQNRASAAHAASLEQPTTAGGPSAS